VDLAIEQLVRADRESERTRPEHLSRDDLDFPLLTDCLVLEPERVRRCPVAFNALDPLPRRAFYELLIEGREAGLVIEAGPWDADGLYKAIHEARAVFDLDMPLPFRLLAGGCRTCDRMRRGAPLEVDMRRLGDVEAVLTNRDGLPVAALALDLRSLEFDADLAAWIAEERIRAPSGLTTDRLGRLVLEGLPRGAYSWGVAGRTMGTFEVLAGETGVTLALPD
jgi:hypothetical protein